MGQSPEMIEHYGQGYERDGLGKEAIDLWEKE